MSLYTHELETIRTALNHISERVSHLLYDGLKVTIKADGSPVTNVDIEVNQILQETLLTAFPKDAWLSEESPDTPSRLHSPRVWILDPIDGTKSLIQRLPHYTISLALIDQGQPAIGVIFNPATQEYYCATHGQSSTLNGQPLHISTTSNSMRHTFLLNAGKVPRSTLKTWRTQHRCPPLLGSIAYSLALVAAGQVDGVIHIGPQNEWDIAAGLLIVQAAGGLVFDNQQQPIQCNQPNPTVNGIIAIRPEALPTIQQWLAEVEA